MSKRKVKMSAPKLKASRSDEVLVVSASADEIDVKEEPRRKGSRSRKKKYAATPMQTRSKSEFPVAVVKKARSKKQGSVTPSASARKRKGKFPDTEESRAKTTRASRGKKKRTKAFFDSEEAEEERKRHAFEEELALLSTDKSIKSDIPPQVELRSADDIERTFDKMAKLLEERKTAVLSDFNRRHKAFSGSTVITEAPTVVLDEAGAVQTIRNLGTVLGNKEYELRKDQQLCVEKLREILYFEESAKDKRLKADTLKAQVATEQATIESRTAEVEKEKDKFEPALKAAMEQLQGISDRDITELANLRKPPATVLMVMEAVMILVQSCGHDSLSSSFSKKAKGKKKGKVDVTKVKYEWGTVRKALTRKLIGVLVDDFNARAVPKKVRKFVEAKYQTNPDFTEERAKKCSKALGPMVPWVLSQLNYMRLLEEMDPIQKEIAKLTSRLKTNLAEQSRVQLFLEELERKLNRSRAEMMELVKRVVDLQDDIKVARKAKAQEIRASCE